MPLLTLNLPTKLPRWTSENPDNITEPGETDKDDGFDVNDHLPSVWYNWLQNFQYQWCKKLAVSTVANWKAIRLDTVTADGSVCVFVDNATFKFWVLYHWSVASQHIHYWLYETFIDETSVPSLDLGSRAAIAYDDTRVILADYLATDHQLAYAPYTLSFTDVDTGLDQQVTAIGIKRSHDDDNFILCGYNNGDIRYAPVVTGSWSAATIPSVSSAIQSICYLLNDSWICVRTNATTFTSIDNGDNWVATTYNPSSFMTAVYSMDVNHATGTVIVVGNGSVSNQDIARSLNGGHDWESVTYKLNGFNTNNFYKVLYCGGGVWVAVGSTLTQTGGPTRKFPGIIISEDDGKTWGLVNCDMYDIDTDLFDKDIKDVACDGSKLVAISEDGTHMFYSQGLPKMID